LNAGDTTVGKTVRWLKIIMSLIQEIDIIFLKIRSKLHVHP